MAVPRIKSVAVLIGYNSDGRSVYSEVLDIHDYYEGEHIWDDAKRVKRHKLCRVKGYLFSTNGELDQEFESRFDAKTGKYAGGIVRYADGTEVKNP
jgi:hypothetical protein